MTGSETDRARALGGFSAGFLRLLARGFQAEPDSRFLAELAGFARELAALLAEEPGLASSPWQAGLRLLAPWLAAPADPAALLELARQYARLFLGADEETAPLCGSAYLSGGLLYQASCREAGECYARHGLVKPANWREPDDHLALELAFLAHLIQEDAAPTEASLSEQREFLARHLAPLGAAAARRILELAPQGFYAGLAQLLAGWLEFEKARLAI